MTVLLHMGNGETPWAGQTLNPYFLCFLISCCPDVSHAHGLRSSSLTHLMVLGGILKGELSEYVNYLIAHMSVCMRFCGAELLTRLLDPACKRTSQSDGCKMK